MRKIIFGFIILLSVTSWGKGESVTFGELRQRLLIQAKKDLFEVEALPEIAIPTKDSSIDLKLAAYHQKGIRKNTFYRINLVNSFDTYGSLQDSTQSTTVYNLDIQELDRNLQPTGTSIKLAAKASDSAVVGNFLQYRDQLSSSPTLQTGRAQIGDYVVNSLPVNLNNEDLPAYSKFKVIGITDEYIPFTLAFRYTLRIRDVRTGRLYDLSAPGLTSLPIWALLVAPENQRIIKFPGGELHY
ncbi:MAG: hypothetical protein ACM3MG_00050 [Bacillota bacterium]